MASLVLPPSGVYAVDFGWAGKAHRRSLRTTSRREAEQLLGVVEQTLADLKRGRLTLPPGVDVGRFVLSGGRAETTTTVPAAGLTLGALWVAYRAAQVGKKEANTLQTEALHYKHLARLVGPAAPLASLTAARVQR